VALIEDVVGVEDVVRVEDVVGVEDFVEDEDVVGVVVEDDVEGPDVEGPDVEGPDVGPDVGGPDVGGVEQTLLAGGLPQVQIVELGQLILIPWHPEEHW